MGGKRKRFELDSMDKLLANNEAYKIFHHAGWHRFFCRLQGYDLTIAKEFAHTFVQDSMTIRGITFPVTVQTVAIITDLPQIGELYFHTASTWVTELKTGRTNFLQCNEFVEVVKGQGA